MANLQLQFTIHGRDRKGKPQFQGISYKVNSKGGPWQKLSTGHVASTPNGILAALHREGPLVHVASIKVSSQQGKMKVPVLSLADLGLHKCWWP